MEDVVEEETFVVEVLVDAVVEETFEEDDGTIVVEEAFEAADAVATVVVEDGIDEIELHTSALAL